jgi:hypothetical protein
MHERSRGVIRLDVTFDDDLVTGCSASGGAVTAPAWQRFCESRGVPLLGQSPDAFLADRVLTPDEQRTVGEHLAYLTDRLPTSIAHASPIFPDTPDDLHHRVTVAFVPLGRIMAGVRSGLQLFSLFPDADPFEAYLFLVHVYYHEVSDLFAAASATEFTVARESASDLRRWLRLLIRNEGIGNYVVLDDLLEFRQASPGYDFKYFTYAPHIGSEAHLAASIRLLNQVFEGVTDANVSHFSENVNLLLKNKALPIINLVGIHMATAVARTHGVDALRNVFGKDAEAFFALYASTAAHDVHPLSNAIIREDGASLASS